MKLSTTCSCALRALVFQARQSAGRFVPADAIAEAEGLSARWVRKALEPLVPAGLLLSAGKLGGGQCLARRARTITLREVVEGVEGPVGGVVPRWTTEAAGVRLDGRFLDVCRGAAEVVRGRFRAVTSADREFEDWWQLVTHFDHLAAERAEMPAAWSGAIEHRAWPSPVTGVEARLGFHWQVLWPEDQRAHQGG